MTPYCKVLPLFVLNLKQQVEKTQKSTEDGCLKLFKFAQLFLFIFFIKFFYSAVKKSKVNLNV